MNNGNDIKETRERDERGRFVKGNRIGEEARFQKENAAACKYKEEYPDLIIKYFKEYEGYPTFEGFAAKIGVDTDTLNNWCVLSARFRCYHARAKEIQKAKLIEGGLIGGYNPQFAKFVAINNHGMSDKTVSDSSISFEIKLPDDIDEEAN